MRSGLQGGSQQISTSIFMCAGNHRVQLSLNLIDDEIGHPGQAARVMVISTWALSSVSVTA